MAGFFFNFLHSSIPEIPRKQDIQKDQIRLVFLGHAQAYDAVFSQNDIKIVFCQKPADQCPVHRIIINEQNCSFFRHINTVYNLF